MPQVDINGHSYEKVVGYGLDGLAGSARQNDGTAADLHVDSIGRLYVVPDEVLDELLNTLRHMNVLLEHLAE